jgi:hypothetical protein
MRGITKITIQTTLLVFGILIANSGWSQTISPRLFGVNAWMPDTIGDVNNCQSPPCIRYGKLHLNWGKVEDSKAVTVRYGGISPDKNIPTMYQYLRMVDSIRAHGMEPILQVPFWDYRYSPQQAAAIVQYINVVKARNVKYWIIGNEPNLSYSYTTAAQIAAYFKQFASAMKSVDPSILIVGPETASFKQTITNGLTTPGGPDDITGRDQNGNFYLDVFTFHTYPFGNGLSGTRADLIAELMLPGNFHDDLLYLKNRLNACNTFHNRTGNAALTMAVTEANVNYTNSSTDDLFGYGTYSFLGGQFVAEMYAIGMKCDVNFINLWSVIEGNSISSNCGYIDKYTGNKQPIYHHFKMMSENMKGSFVNCTKNQVNVKSFGSQDAQEVCVLIMNEELSVNHTYTVRLNTATIAGNSTLKINANANIGAEYTDVIQNQSTVLLVFNLAGNLIRKCEYSLMGHAAANQPPTCTTYILTSTPVKAPLDEEMDMNVFPNPSTGTFTIELNGTNSEHDSSSVEIINLIGQTIFNKRFAFTNGSEELQMDPSLAKGVYIIRIREGKFVATRRIVLQ